VHTPKRVEPGRNSRRATPFERTDSASNPSGAAAAAERLLALLEVREGEVRHAPLQRQLRRAADAPRAEEPLAAAVHDAPVHAEAVAPRALDEEGAPLRREGGDVPHPGDDAELRDGAAPLRGGVQLSSSSVSSYIA
jgi:hypothetical protein